MKAWHALLPALLAIALPALAADPPGFIRALSAANIDEFMRETQAVLSGEHPEGVSIDDMGNYFVNHLGDKGVYKSVIRFEIPGQPTQEKPLVLTKEAYINNLMQGRLTLQGYKSSYEKIAEPVIAPGGKSATIVIRTLESGFMPVAGEDGKPVMVPFEGRSECTEQIGISWNHFIQVTGADCRTTLIIKDSAAAP